MRKLRAALRPARGAILQESPPRENARGGNASAGRRATRAARRQRQRQQQLVLRQFAQAQFVVRHQVRLAVVQQTALLGLAADQAQGRVQREPPVEDLEAALAQQGQNAADFAFQPERPFRIAAQREPCVRRARGRSQAAGQARHLRHGQRTLPAPAARHRGQLDAQRNALFHARMLTDPDRGPILASGSPYRAALLARLRLPFEVAVAPVDERPRPDEEPAALAQRLAAAKARAVAAARAQLAWLSGRRAEFFTAVALLRGEVCHEALDLTTVQFRALGESEIERYLDAEPALDCAGSFKSEEIGIALCAAIETRDPSALIGLPRSEE